MSPEEPEDPEVMARIIAQETIARVLSHVCPTLAPRARPDQWAKTVRNRAVAVLWVVHPDWFGGVALSTLAARLSVPVDCLQREADRFSREFGVSYAGKWSKECGRKESFTNNRALAGSAREHRLFVKKQKV